MAAKKDTEVTQAAEDAAGVDAGQVKPTADMSAGEVKANLAKASDADIHPGGEPKREADRTSYPVPNDAEIHDPPIRSALPDGELVQSLATGAGAHEPPDPKMFDAEGRPRSS